MKKTFVPLNLILFTLTLGSCEYEQPFSPMKVEMNETIDNKQSFQKAERILNDAQNVDKSKMALGLLEVQLDTQLTKLFDPKNHPCGDLPGKVLNKLNGKSWMPKSLSRQMSRIPKKASYLMGQSVSVLIHSVEIIKTDGTKLPSFVVYGSPTFKNFNLESYMDTGNFDSYVYTLDCAGYFSAALEVSGTKPGGDVSAKAGAALDNSGSLMLAYGTLYSPFLGALRPNLYGITIPDTTRLAISSALESRLPSGLGDSDIIDLSERYMILWASKQGKSGFNGEASFKASGNVNVGIARLSANTSAGGTLSRSSNFTNFDTYLLNSVHASDVAPVTIKELKDALAALRRTGSALID